MKLLVLILTILLVHRNGVVFGKCKTKSLSEVEKVILLYHNQYRALHKDTSALCYGASDSAVSYTSASWATTLAGKGAMQHSKNGKYGENLYYRTTGKQGSAATTFSYKNATYHSALSSWYSEIEDWNFGKSKGKNSRATGHFTQIVWRDTTEVNCGITTRSKKTFVVCQYYSPGNFANKYADNVLPPSSGAGVEPGVVLLVAVLCAGILSRDLYTVL